MAKNYVCNGAKIECKACATPEGELKVTSNEIKIQDKLFANAKDKEKINLIFKGNCTKSPYQSSPCQAVRKVEDWQGVADAFIQDDPALLEDSTIMCTYGGVPIKITDDLQVSELTELSPTDVAGIAPVMPMNMLITSSFILGGKIAKTITNSTNSSETQGDDKIITTAYFAEKVENKEEYNKIETIPFGEEFYIIIEGKNVKGKKVGINIFDKSKTLSIVSIEGGKKAVPVIVSDKQEVFLKGTFNKFDSRDQSDFAVIKIKLRPKSDDDYKKSKDSLNKLKDKKAQLSLLVDIHSTNSDIDKKDITYQGKKYGDDSEFTNVWLDNDSEYFDVTPEKYKVCPIDPKYRSHFVIHCTAGNMSKSSIISKLTYYTKKKVKKTKRSGAHIYVMKDGSKVQIWPLTEKNVWATKIESKKNLKGQMFHIELNYGPPDKPTEAQYQTLADLYVEASKTQKCWPIIAPHIEMDRGYTSGHQDPTDFDYNHFYGILKKKGLPIDDITKFEHNRYWGHKSYKVPWSTDKTNWPPILTGNPHK